MEDSDNSRCRDKPGHEWLQMKRATDRLNQHKTRLRSKYSVAELQAQLQGLLQGDQHTRMRMLIEKNDQLRATVARCESKMEDLMQSAKRFLEDGEMSAEVDTEVEATDALKEPDPQPAEGHLNPGIRDDFRVVLANQRALGPRFDWYTKQHSIFFLATADICIQDKVKLSGSRVNDVLELVIVWKLKNGYTDTSCKLLQDWSAQAPTPGPPWTPRDFEQAGHREGLLQAICDEIHHQKTLECATTAQNPTCSTINSIQFQRRIVALIASRNVAAWKQYLRSPTLHAAIFWGHYRYLLFLIFPTNKNWNEIPPWYRPTMSQFLHRHPWSIDGVPWPRMRERLIWTWEDYSEQSLLVTIARHMAFTVPIAADTLISPTPDNSDFQIDESFRQAIWDVNNFRLLPSFDSRFPELTSLAGSGMMQPHYIASPPPPLDEAADPDWNLVITGFDFPFPEKPSATVGTHFGGQAG